MEQSLEYPKHVESFELYYYMGEGRTLKKLAQLKMIQDFPDVTGGTPEYESKLNVMHTRVKRWSVREAWRAWIGKKEEEERASREEAMREQNKSLVETVRLYQKMIRYALSIAAKDIKDGVIKLKNASEIKTFLELDQRLGEIITNQPQFLPSMMERLLGEKDRRKVDEVFEYLHLKALSEIDGAGKDGDSITPKELVKGEEGYEEEIPSVPSGGEG